MTDNNHISVTQVNMHALCARRYYYRYVEGLKIPPLAVALRGGATHEANEANMTEKLNEGTMLSEEQVSDIASEAVRTRWEDEGVRLVGDEVEQGEHRVQGATVDSAIRLAVLHRNHLAPAIQPQYVEREFRLAVDGLPEVLGFIDLQETSGTIRDTKTKAKSPSKQEIEDVGRDFQLATYALAFRTLDGAQPTYPVAKDWLVDLKTPKAVTATANLTDENCIAALERISIAAKSIETGLFPPSTDGWWCSEKWCGYWGVCPYGAKSRVAVSIGGEA